MTKMKTTKKALFASVLSLLLCVSMLIGSTFAWFTDSASTGVNTIQTGNLDIDLYKGTVANDAITYEEVVDDETLLFNNDALWEPGYTEVAYLKVENVGSLALKALLTVNFAKQVAGTSVDGNEIKLSNYLMYDLIEIDEGEFYATREEAREAAKSEATLIATEQNEINLDAGDPAKYYALVVYMPEEVGNEANYRGDTVPSIQLCVTLIATQDTVENDSWDNQYDEDSEYPSNIKNNEGLFEALESSDNVTIKNGNYELPLTIPEGKTVNVEGGDFTIDNEKSGSALTVSKDANLTISKSDIDVSGHKTCISTESGSTLTVNAGTYATSSIQTMSVSTDSTIYITGGKFESGCAIFWMNGSSDIVISGGEFIINTTGTRGLVVNEGSSKLTITGGTFDTGTLDASTGVDATITGGTFKFDPSANVDLENYNVTEGADGWFTVTAK